MRKTAEGIPDEMRRALDRCSEEPDKVIHDQAAEQEKLAVPVTLYHYTDGPGVLGILESGMIRLTDIFGLNDSSEIRHGIQRASAVLAEESKRGHPAAKPPSTAIRSAGSGS